MTRIPQPVKWAKTLKWIRRTFPPLRKTVIQSLSDKAIGGDCGDAELVRGVWVIRINKQQCTTLKIDTLIHEYAHSLTVHLTTEGEDHHSPEWGLKYAQIYRAFWGWGYGRGPEEEG